MNPDEKKKLQRKIHRLGNPLVCYNGDKHWYNAEWQYHRIDGPAVEGEDGLKAWYQNGKLHRTDGPAIESADGSRTWLRNGEWHRTDGPAIEYASGYKEWCLNGTQLSEDLFLKVTQGPVKNLPLYLGMGMGFDEFISERIKEDK